MTDTHPILHHKRNITRYCRMLTTPLTNIEREYIHKRIVQERIELERLTSAASESADLTADRAAMSRQNPPNASNLFLALG